MSRAVTALVPEAILEVRAHQGLDLFDEMWDGVLHMVPPPGYVRQTVGTKLLSFLEPRLSARGIEVRYEMGVFRPGSAGRDYRVPDLVFFSADRPGLVTERGLEGAPLAVVEVRSPDDETFEKFDFWAALGVPEIVVITPDTRAVEVYRLAEGRYTAATPDAEGWVRVSSIDVRCATVPGAEPRLRVERDDAGRLI